MANSFELSAVDNGGIYTGTFPGGGSGSYAGMWFTISGFTDPANNGTFQATDSDTTSITTTNSTSVSETHAATATDATIYTCLDPGGAPSTIVKGASDVGSLWSIPFSVLDRPGGGLRHVWLQSSIASMDVSAFVVDFQQSFDGGKTWQTMQSGIDLFGAPTQQVTPSPSPGATLRLSVATFTTASPAEMDVIASAN